MRSIIFILEFLILGCLVINESHARPMTENAAIQEYLERLLKSGYNKNIFPVSSEGHGNPLQVRCSFYLLDVHKVDEASMDYRVQFYFRQTWNDSRLSYLDQDISTIVLSNAKLIWTPDLFFVQEKEGLVHNLVAPNVFIRINPEGEVLYSLRMSMTFSCPMDFRKYPHDTQKCRFTIESYGFNREQMQLSWDDNQFYEAVGSSNEIELLTFKFKGIKEGIKHLSEKYGDFTNLEVELTFQRKFGFFVTRLYVPFTFLISISWLSLWIPVKLVVPRLSLLLVIMYLMVNIAADINNYIPPASYTKGSDVWIAFCESLLFASFLQYVAVYIIYRHKDNFQNRINKNKLEAHLILNSDDKKTEDRSESANSALHMLSVRLQTNALVSSRIDKASRVLFPVLFLVFNFIYWILYSTGH